MAAPAQSSGHAELSALPAATAGSQLLHLPNTVTRVGWACSDRSQGQGQPWTASRRVGACEAPPASPSRTHPIHEGTLPGAQAESRCTEPVHLATLRVAEFQKPTSIRGQMQAVSDRKEPALRGHSLASTWEATRAYGPSLQTPAQLHKAPVPRTQSAARPGKRDSPDADNAPRGGEALRRTSPEQRVAPQLHPPPRAPDQGRSALCSGHIPALRLPRCPLPFLPESTGHLLLHSEWLLSPPHVFGPPSLT